MPKSSSAVRNSNKKRKQAFTTDSEEPSWLDGEGKTNDELAKELLKTKQKLAKTEQKLTVTEKKLSETEDRVTKAEALVESLQKKVASGSNGGDEEEDLSEDEDSVASDDASDPWVIRFNELREYRILNGNCSVPRTGPQSNLSQWVNNQKTAYKNIKNGKKGLKLTPERINKLESLGFSWGKAFTAPVAWDTHFEELKKYQGAMGHCNIHISPKDPSPLAKWVSFQRSEYRRFSKGRDSLLSLDQIKQLKDIGFNWKGPRLDRLEQN